MTANLDELIAATKQFYDYPTAVRLNVSRQMLELMQDEFTRTYGTPSTSEPSSFLLWGVPIIVDDTLPGTQGAFLDRDGETISVLHWGTA